MRSSCETNKSATRPGRPPRSAAAAPDMRGEGGGAAPYPPPPTHIPQNTTDSTPHTPCMDGGGYDDGHTRKTPTDNRTDQPRSQSLGRGGWGDRDQRAGAQWRGRERACANKRTRDPETSSLATCPAGRQPRARWARSAASLSCSVRSGRSSFTHVLAPAEGLHG